MLDIKKTITSRIHLRRGTIERKSTGTFFLNKRQKFVLSVIVLSVGLFILEYLFTGYGFWLSLFLAILTDILFFASMYVDAPESLAIQSLILPFLYSLSFGLFYFLAPSRLITRIVFTSLYAIGLYSLFLCENIFTVASIRTIQLLNGARIVSMVVTLISYFFLTNIIFSLRIPIIPTTLLLFSSSFLFLLHSIWIYTLEKKLSTEIEWVITLSLCIFQLGVILWFWPSTPTLVSLFLTGMIYTLVGLTHAWLDRRLFKGVLWEYLWIIVFTFVVLIAFTQWS